VTQTLQRSGISPVASQRTIIFLYAALGILLMLFFIRLSSAAEAHRVNDNAGKSLLGIASSRAVVLRLAGLFALDAFGGGFVVQSFAAYWFYLRFGVNP